MNIITKLAWKSLNNRLSTVALTIFTVAISVMLVLGVEQIRTQAKESFSNTISGTDLIVGGRSGSTNLLLYSVFHIGNATNNIDWKSYQEFSQHRAVKWAVPISLGDSHRGFRVMGTNEDYFSFFKYGRKQSLNFSKGRSFSSLFETVIGADVAKKLNYHIGDKIVIAHGLRDAGFSRHDNLPFVITGILAPTGTPVDKTVHVSLEAIEAIHIGWESGANLGYNPTQKEAMQADLQPKQITAMLVGLKSKIQTFTLQRQINTYKQEPLSAILPGVALAELWSMMSIAEQALLIISFFVVISGLIGMLCSLLTSLHERRREMAILRAMGAKPQHIATLLISEATAITFLGILSGFLFLQALLLLFSPVLQSHYGLTFDLRLPHSNEWLILGMIQLSGIFLGAIPAFKAYKNSLSDGMSIRV
ncbi:ABC transporter permease [Vibrio sp.]|nr:ABC transporter permease [Vibrio sp.]